MVVTSSILDMKLWNCTEVTCMITQLVSGGTRPTPVALGLSYTTYLALLEGLSRTGISWVFLRLARAMQILLHRSTVCVFDILSSVFDSGALPQKCFAPLPAGSWFSYQFISCLLFPSLIYLASFSYFMTAHAPQGLCFHSFSLS